MIDEFTKLAYQARQDGIDSIVVGAYLVYRNQVLLVQRRDDEFYGGFFELPSGNLEKNESLPTALVREVMEETGISISENDIGVCVDSFEYLSSDKKRKKRQLNFIVMLSYKPKIKLSKEHQKYLWATESAVDSSEFDEVLRDNLKKLFRHIRESSDKVIS